MTMINRAVYRVVGVACALASLAIWHDLNQLFGGVA
jgi:hypothetical protein